MGPGGIHPYRALQYFASGINHDDLATGARASVTAAPARFLTREQVADELATSKAQVYALIRRGELRGIKIGNRGQWRIERSELEDYIQRMYGETNRWVEEHPFDDDDGDPPAGS